MRITKKVLGLLVLCTTSASAQTAVDRAMTFGVFGGGSRFTASDASQLSNSRWHAGALAELRTPLRWLAVRVDGSYRGAGTVMQDITNGGGQVIGGLNTRTNIVTASASLVARTPRLGTRLQPYALAGVTAFRFQSRTTASPEFSTDGFPGSSVLRRNELNVGLGLETPVGKTSMFAEARFSRTSSSSSYVPLSLGVRF